MSDSETTEVWETRSVTMHPGFWRALDRFVDERAHDQSLVLMIALMEWLRPLDHEFRAEFADEADKVVIGLLRAMRDLDRGEAKVRKLDEGLSK
jgi:hypothetical protein